MNVLSLEVFWKEIIIEFIYGRKQSWWTKLLRNEHRLTHTGNLHIKQKGCTTWGLDICMYYQWRYYKKNSNWMYIWKKILLQIENCKVSNENWLRRLIHFRAKKCTTYWHHICRYYHWRYFERKLKSNLSMVESILDDQKHWGKNTD